MATDMDTRPYYDEFADWYEKERGGGYHRMLDDLELELVEQYGRDKDILEAGCGTGLLLSRARSFARSHTGVDISHGMLSTARERDLEVTQATITSLPFADHSFDLVYAVKVLPHIEGHKDSTGGTGSGDAPRRHRAGRVLQPALPALPDQASQAPQRHLSGHH